MNNAQLLMSRITDDSCPVVDCMEVAPGVVKALIHYVMLDTWTIERITFRDECEPEFEELARFYSEKEAKISF